MCSISGHSVSASRSSLALVLLLSVCLSVAPSSFASRTHLQVVQAPTRVSPTDEQFLGDLEQRSFRYFWDQADPATGLVPDRARTDGSSLDQNHQNVRAPMEQRGFFDRYGAPLRGRAYSAAIFSRRSGNQ